MSRHRAKAAQHSYRQRVKILLFRSLFAVLQLVPPIASRVAFRRFFRPRRSRQVLIPNLVTYDIVVRGQTVRVYEGGKGLGVLIVHGWESSAARLTVLMNSLIANNFRVVAFDMPAHGSSSGRDTDILQITDVIVHLANSTGPFTAAIGHSFGGVCLANAMRSNFRVNRLVLIAAPADLAGIIDKYCEILGIWWPTKIRLTQAIQARLGADEREFDIRTILQRTGIPTLIIHDRKDPVVPFSESEEVARFVAEAELVATDGLGHSRITRHIKTIDKCVTFISQGKTAFASRLDVSG